MTARLRKFACDGDWEPDEYMPALCCPDCRRVSGLEPRLGPPGQLYHCGKCNHDWRVGRPAPTPHSPLASVSNAVHIVMSLALIISGFIFALSVGAFIIISNDLRGDARLFAILLMMVLLMVVTINVLFVIYEGIIFAFSRVTRYLLNQSSPIQEVL